MLKQPKLEACKSLNSLLFFLLLLLFKKTKTNPFKNKAKQKKEYEKKINRFPMLFLQYILSSTNVGTNIYIQIYVL